MAVSIVKTRCPQNHSCPAVRVCRTGALTQQGWNAPEVVAEKCVDCNACIRYCPMGAFKAES